MGFGGFGPFVGWWAVPFLRGPVFLFRGRSGWGVCVVPVSVVALLAEGW